MPPEPQRDPIPASLRTAVLLLAAEAVVLGLATVFLLYAGITAREGSLLSALGTTLFAALLAALLGWLALSLFRRRAWARGPAIVLQLLLVPIAITMIGGGLPTLGFPVLLIGLVGAGTLVAPTTRAALDGN